jgi:hypothetical protein
VPSNSVTVLPTVTAPTATGGSGKTQTTTYLKIVAVLAALALIAGLSGLFMTRDRTLPATAGGAPLPPPAPLDPPAGSSDTGYWSPQDDADHDWGSQTPGPPPPPPPPGPDEE